MDKFEHVLSLTGVGNARQLGGYPAGGRTVRSGVLLRTASLAGASAEALEKLEKELHVAVVIDFRMSFERNSAPDPVIPGVKNLFLPVMEMQDSPQYAPELIKKIDFQHMDRMAMMQMAIDMGLLDENLYETFVLGERGKKAYRQFFSSLLELPENRAILWHCTDGKDRTGVASMLLLSALGADRETIMEDYLMTNVMNRQLIDGVRAKLEQSSMSPEHRKFMLFGTGAVYEEYMLHALKAIDAQFGSMDAYLEKELGIGSEERTALQEKFLR